MPAKSIRQNTPNSRRPVLDIDFVLNTIWTVTTAWVYLLPTRPFACIKISCASKESILVDDRNEYFIHYGMRIFKVPNNPSEYFYTGRRARNSLFYPLEGLIDVFDGWSADIRAWGMRATYMKSTTEPFLIHKHKLHRHRHPNAPNPTNTTIMLCHEALYDNGAVDFQYIQTFTTWLRKLNGDYDMSESRPRDRTESFLLPELQGLESFLHSICKAYQEYEYAQSDLRSEKHYLDPMPANTPSSNPTAIMLAPSPPRSSSSRAADNSCPSECQESVTKYRNSDQKSTNDDVANTQNVESSSSSSSSSLTLTPSQTTYPTRYTTRVAPLLPNHFHPAKHPYDGQVYFHALHLVKNAIARLETLLEEIEAYFALAEDMGDVYTYWYEKIERWAAEREKREKEWRKAERERKGLGVGFGERDGGRML